MVSGSERRLAAIMFTDIVGYTTLMAESEERGLRARERHRALVRPLVERYHGQSIESRGDESLSVFPTALDAVNCALAIRDRLQSEADLKLHIGIHIGDVVMAGGEVSGDGVNIASRICSLSESAGLRVSAEVYRSIRNQPEIEATALGEQELKNVPEPVAVYAVSGKAAPPRPISQAVLERPAATNQSALKALTGRPDVAVLVVPAVWVFSVAVVFEILFMASPFALYYYSAYGLPLNWFHGSPWTAWLTEFFLPHFSVTSSPFLNGLPYLGGILIVSGMTLFLVGFLQVYWAKLRRQDPVTTGLYAVLRHPQYVALAIAGLGTVLLWPRFLVLISYITMLFLYTGLARWEEQRCLQKFDESYRAYLERTAALLHRRLLARLSRLLPASGSGRIAAILVLYAVSIVLVVGVGNRVRDFSLSQLSSLYTERMAVISPAPLTQQELRAALRVASADAAVRESLDDAGPSAQLLVYVVPLEWDIADLAMERDKKVWGHQTPAEFDRSNYRVLFTKVRTHDPAASGKEILARAHGRDPMILVKVDLETEQVLAREMAAQHNVRWGDIPTPLF